MGIKGHQSSISLASYGTDMGINRVLKDTKVHGTDMGIKGHQISISLATVQTWVLKDTKAVYH